MDGSRKELKPFLGPSDRGGRVAQAVTVRMDEAREEPKPFLGPSDLGGRVAQAVTVRIDGARKELTAPAALSLFRGDPLHAARAHFARLFRLFDVLQDLPHLLRLLIDFPLFGAVECLLGFLGFSLRQGARRHDAPKNYPRADDSEGFAAGKLVFRLLVEH